MPEAGKERAGWPSADGRYNAGTEFAGGLFVIHDEQIHRQGRTARNDCKVEIWPCHANQNGSAHCSKSETLAKCRQWSNYLWHYYPTVAKWNFCGR